MVNIEKIEYNDKTIEILLFQYFYENEKYKAQVMLGYF